MAKVTQLTLVTARETVVSSSELAKEIIIAVQLKLLVAATVMLGALWYGALRALEVCS